MSNMSKKDKLYTQIKSRYSEKVCGKYNEY